jgi:hypothetical protein
MQDLGDLLMEDPLVIMKCLPIKTTGYAIEEISRQSGESQKYRVFGKFFIYSILIAHMGEYSIILNTKSNCKL